jgi:hypothetical protein
MMMAGALASTHGSPEQRDHPSALSAVPHAAFPKSTGAGSSCSENHSGLSFCGGPVIARVRIIQGTQILVAGLIRTIHLAEETSMRSKLTVSALAVASFLATTAIASAQNEPQSAPSAAKSHVKHHQMKSSHVKPGTTTGMSHRSSTAKPSAAGAPTSNKSSGY